MTASILKFVTVLFGASVLSLAAVAAEWCPKDKGLFPAAVVDLGEYKAFYFVPGRIYSEQGQTAIVYLTKNNAVISTTSAEGISDYFSSTIFEGPSTGFSCDSVTLKFESAWLIDENGQRINFRIGEVRESDNEEHELVCE
ncbi:hypothetical protein ACLVWU_15380 [Bdellovibrio sp. HCB290]|uniref:hypothetical protein n=1 Tax=Bdellovibrio sp. HCB290 TaxID=3394356 RepID=UPI0039B4A1EF